MFFIKIYIKESYMIYYHTSIQMCGQYCILAPNSPDDSTKQLIQLAPSKRTHINMAMAFLMSKKQWRPQSIWSAISKLNRVIARPESGNMFYQIIARYFEKFRDIAPVEVGNVIRIEIANYLLEHQNWIQVRKFEVQNASKLYIAFLFFVFLRSIDYFHNTS